MADGDELRINAALLKALGLTPEDDAQPAPEVVLAACLHRLALETGLAEREDPNFGWVERAGVPQAALKLLNYFIGDPATPINDDVVRDGLYDALLALAADSSALKFVDKKRSFTGDELLMFAQIYWNLEADGRRTKLLIRSGQKLSSGLQARIKVPCADEDFAALELKNRAARTPGYTSDGGAFYVRGARIAVLAAKRIALGKEAPAVGARFCSTGTGRGTEWSIVWPTDEANAASPELEGVGFGELAKASVRFSPAAPPGDRHAGARPVRAPLAPGSLESVVAEAPDRVGTLPDLRVVTTRTGTFNPANFLSGASMNPTEVDRYAVARRVDMDGDALAVDEVATRLAAEEMVGYLVAGAGEGKSTYLHALRSSLVDRAIVFTWRATGQLDWPKLQDFRDVVASVSPTKSRDEPPIVIVGELQTKPTREQEDALIEIVQGIPSGLATPRTSILLAGRPAWLNRIRQRASTGLTMRLMPLAGGEAEALIENLADAHLACRQDKGPAWTGAHFPNLGQFLALPHASRVAVFLQGSSLVGSLLHAAYGRKFTDRLRVEYTDLEPAERAAYLLVSLATSSLGGISEELLESICPDANIERSSAGSPWQRDIDGMHSARHEMIGKLVVEDKGASTARDISQMIGKIVGAAIFSLEARDLFLNSVRIFDEWRSLVPEQQRKTEPQFRAALRSGILENRESWERLEQSIGPGPGELLAYSYALQRLLPEGRRGGAEYLLVRSEHLLAAAEAAATPGSPFAYRAQYHRIFVARAARRIRGDVADDPRDIKALIPMMSHTWPEPIFYAQVLSLGLSTLRHCDLDEDESDQIAGAVLDAWQRLRVEGDTREQIYGYSTFVARELYDWPQSRRLSLWETAWDFSRALASPDGSLACLIDAELIKLERSSTGEDAAALRERRWHILSQSVVAHQSDAEVALRFAELAGTDDETARRRVLRVGRQLASSDDPTTRAMALHALAIVATSDEERLDNLRPALPAYEQSIISRDDWLTRGPYWKRALRELRGIAPDEASVLDAQIAAAGRRFSI